MLGSDAGRRERQLNIAYVTPDNCGSGHAVRGIALVHAAKRAGIELRAFGPPVRPNGPLPDLAGYEGSTDWRQRVLQWQPDLLLGDLRPEFLETLRLQLGVPAWLLMRIWPKEWRGAPSWTRVVSIELGAESLPLLTDSVPPIVGPMRYRPEDGAEVQAGYNAWWEAAWYGYHDRVQWTDGGNRERALRIVAGPVAFAENGADVLVAQAGGFGTGRGSAMSPVRNAMPKENTPTALSNTSATVGVDA